MSHNVIGYASQFADHLESKFDVIHGVLRRYQSKEVVDDEIRRSVEALRSLSELKKYFGVVSQKTSVFLPLNLPLYSFVLFAVMPALQSDVVLIRPPQRMQELLQLLLEEISSERYFPNISVFQGGREAFAKAHCKDASVVIFVGNHHNFMQLSKSLSRECLVLYNGVGHNPIVVTPSADIEVAAEKTLKVKLFNNGQDCAGPDAILVHSTVIDAYLEALHRGLAKVRCDGSYAAEDVRIGPLFESASLLRAIQVISEMRKRGAVITYGGQIDLNNNMMRPCVMRMRLCEIKNYIELYCPIFVVSEYEYDRELALYFAEDGGRYQEHQMYISLFGESGQVAKVRGSVILRNCTIHDIERGTEEYGGYSYGASSVSFRGIRIPKPILIPREISNFLSPDRRVMFAPVSEGVEVSELSIVTTQFREIVERVFGNHLVFGCIFGSFAVGQDKRYSDIDTLVCVRQKDLTLIREYLTWLFGIHEVFGRIPDFKYPAEIVTLTELEDAVSHLSTLRLSATNNESRSYDTMVWCHALSQTVVGVVHPENIPEFWKGIFPAHSQRILRSFLNDVERAMLEGSAVENGIQELPEIPRTEPELSRYLDNLSRRGLLAVLKSVPFEEAPVYGDIVAELVAGREFMGRSKFSSKDVADLYHPCFRFGVVSGVV